MKGNGKFLTFLTTEFNQTFQLFPIWDRIFCQYFNIAVAIKYRQRNQYIYITHQKFKQHRSLMLNFQTPTKHPHKPTSKTTSQSKLQDWICLVCNNLNFSFRKKCNRCKSQTRSQNEYQVQIGHPVAEGSRTVCSYYYCENTRLGPESTNKSVFSDATNLCTPQRKYVAKDQQISNGRGTKNQGEDWMNASMQYKGKEMQGHTTVNNKNQNQQQWTDRKKDESAIMNQYWQFINVQNFDTLLQPPTNHNNPIPKESTTISDNIDQQVDEAQQEEIDLEITRMFHKILLE